MSYLCSVSCVAQNTCIGDSYGLTVCFFEYLLRRSNRTDDIKYPSECWEKIIEKYSAQVVSYLCSVSCVAQNTCIGDSHGLTVCFF